MRMPLTYFFAGGDPKFMIVLTVLLVLAVIHFIKKVKARNDEKGGENTITERNSKLHRLTTWTLIIAAFSLLLGLLHSFYFIGQAVGIAPHLMFQGISRMLITPVYGIAIAIITKILEQVMNLKSINSNV